MSEDGCRIQCDIDGRPYEENVNRYECDCIPGYTRGYNGVCGKNCTLKYGDSKIILCEDNPENCCCPAGYTYVEEKTA